MRDGTLTTVDGGLAQRRVATGIAAPALRAEVAVLATLSGLAVPVVLATADDGATVEVLTTFGPPPPTLSAGILAEVATTLAAAHDRAIVHGALTAECVGLGRDGTPVIDGWRGQGHATDDVAALGALLAAVATTSTERAVAARATATDPSTRPTMRAISEALAPPRSRSLPTHRPSRSPSRQRTAGVVALCLVAAAVAATAAAAAAVGVGRLGGESGGGAASARSVESRGRPALATNVVTHDGARVKVGQTGDVVIVGDWDCDGGMTPALLRPGEHTIWVWHSWTAPPHQRRADRRAISLRAVRSHDCDRLIEVGAEGAPVH